MYERALNFTNVLVDNSVPPLQDYNADELDVVTVEQSL